MSDFDGTLSRIVSEPRKAELKPELGRLLKILAGKSGVRVAVISGRAIDEIKGLVNLPGVYYAGNHGLEIKGPGIDYIHPRARRLVPVTAGMEKRLKEALKTVPGIIIENKSISLGVHYRLVAGDRIGEARKIFNRVAKDVFAAGDFRISSGKKVWELRPEIDWDKGKAARMLWRSFSGGSHRPLPVYLGDDITDEDAFAALSGKGITVRIGRRAGSRAEYFLRSIKEVAEFLPRLAEFSWGGERKKRCTG